MDLVHSRVDRNVLIEDFVLWIVAVEDWIVVRNHSIHDGVHSNGVLVFSHDVLKDWIVGFDLPRVGRNLFCGAVVFPLAAG